MDLVKALNSQYMKEELPEVKVGDTVRVHVRIKEGARERIQVFEGTVIARKHLFKIRSYQMFLNIFECFSAVF